MDNADAEKARKKETHRRSMIVTGAMIAASALAGAWIGFAPGKLLPSIRLRPADPGAPLQPRRPMLVQWAEFSPQTLARAQKEDRLVFL